jgi:hypothetical protein
MKTANDARQEWLNSLKVGDAVNLFPSMYRNPVVVSIERETATRWILKGGAEIYKTNGNRRGDVMGFIVPLDDARTKTIKELKTFDWSKLTTQQLLDVLKIISETTK